MSIRALRLTSQITVALMAITGIAAAMTAGFAWLASEQVDDLALARQADIIKHELQDQIRSVAKEQQSIAVGDDAVTYTRAGDQKWMSENFGQWLHAYFGHDLGYVLDDRNKIIFSMRDGKSASLIAPADDQATIDTFAAEIRRRLRTSSRTPEDSAALRSTSATEVVLIEGRPAIVSGRPILPSTSKVAVAQGSEFLQIAIKFLDGNLLREIGEHARVEGTKYIPGYTNIPETAVAVVGLEGNILGYLTWKPIKPGLMLLKKTAPGALIGFAIVAGAVFYLGLGLRRTSRKLLDSKMELVQHRSELEETVQLRTAEIERQSAELDRMLTQERQVNELQRQFVAMASHEFRTPLAVIDAAAQRLIRQKETPTSAYIAAKVVQIRQSVARMVDLMESILSAGRLARGIEGIHPSDVDLVEVIETCCKRQSEIKRTHEFHLDFINFPPAVTADASALEQVFTNLIANAVKYSPSAPDIFIKGWEENGTIYVSVRDQGIGMDAEDIPKLFQPYFRARSSTGIAGTGIGLNLVKQIIDLHGGSVTVESVLGRGTTFTLSMAVSGQQSASLRSNNEKAA